MLQTGSVKWVVRQWPLELWWALGVGEVQGTRMGVAASKLCSSVARQWVAAQSLGGEVGSDAILDIGATALNDVALGCSTT